MKTLSFNNNQGITVNYLTDLIDGNEQFTVLQITTNTNGEEIVGLTDEVIRLGADVVKIGICYMLVDFINYATQFGYSLIETSEENPNPIYLVDNRGVDFEVLSVTIDQTEFTAGDTLTGIITVKNSGLSGSGTVEWQLVGENEGIVDSGEVETGNVGKDEEKELDLSIETSDSLEDDNYYIRCRFEGEDWVESEVFIGRSWSSYWESRYISALSVLTTGDTTQTITATIVGTGFDTCNFEYSTDNGVNWITGDSAVNGILNKTGLTADTNYLWRARLSKGAQYGSYSTTASAYTYTAEAQALFAACGTQPSASDKSNLNTSIKGLIDDGVLAEMDWACFYAMPTADASLINLKAPGTLNPSLISTPVFAAYQGYTGATNKAINNNFVLATHGSKFTQNSGHMAWYIRTTNAGAKHHGGVIGANNQRFDLLPKFTDNKFYWFANDATGGNSANSYDVSGMYILTRNAADEVKLYRNGVEIHTSTRASAGVPTTYSVWDLAANNKGTGANWADNEIAFKSIGGELTAAQVTALTAHVETWMDANSKGVIPPLVEVFDETKFIDGMVQADEGTYKSHTALSRFKFTTDATILKIKVKSTLYTTIPSLYGWVIVYVDSTRYNYKFTDENYKTIILPSGTKTIQIIEEGTSIPSGTTMLGTYITSILSNGTTNTIDSSEPANRRTFLCDSIGVGASATYMFDGWTTLFRQAGEAVNHYGWGYNSIFDIASTAEKRTATVSFIDSLMDGSSTNTLIIALGTNDYGIPKCSAADFQTYYAALLTAINAARPDIVIKCLTPYDRGTETANSYGNTLGDYRTAITNAASGKAYASVVDGDSGILTVPTDFNTDQLHPLTTGHAKLYTALSGSL